MAYKLNTVEITGKKMRAKYLLRFMLLLSVIFVTGCHLKSAKIYTTEPKPIEPKPVEPKPIEAKPIEAKPIEAKPIEAKPIEAKPIEAKPIEAKPIEAKPIEAKPIEAKPVVVNSTFSFKGRITLDQSKLKEKNAEVGNTIVYFKPANKLSTKLPKTDAVISTSNKQFEPNVIAITAGSTISFPNMDRILHNVFSVSPMSEFDLGLYSAGLSKDVVFENPGVIYVHCNVHHSMQADILVLDTPFFTQVEDDGSFALKNIPQLAGTLHTWHPRGKIESLELTTDSDHENIKKSVVITRPVVPKHRNKFGKSYRRTRY